MNLALLIQTEQGGDNHLVLQFYKQNREAIAICFIIHRNAKSEKVFLSICVAGEMVVMIECE